MLLPRACAVAPFSSTKERPRTTPPILVADDGAQLIELIRDVLLDAGYIHTVAHLGDHAFERICDEHPALVLLDITVMNPGNAWALLDLLRLHPQTRTIPVILLSTDLRLLNDKTELLRTLHCQVLEKPFDIEALLDKVAAAIGPPLASGR